MQPVTTLTRSLIWVGLLSTMACRAGKDAGVDDTSEANAAPVPRAGIVVTTDEDASTVIKLSATDPDGDTLEYAIAVAPEHGSLSPEVPGRQSQVTYTPDPDYNGDDSFAFTVSDEKAVSESELVSVTVVPVNDAPVVPAPILVETQEGESVVVLLSANDIDDVDLTFRDRSPPANGTLDTTDLPRVIYTPNDNFSGEDSFTYLASDGLLDSPENTVVVNVLDVNDPPVGVADFYETDEDTLLAIGAPGVLANDTDIDFDALSAVQTSEPSHGTLTLNSDGSFEYMPGANETSDVSFTYVVNDGSADSEETTVIIELDGINDAPIGLVDEYELDEDTVAFVGSSVLTNDLEAEIDGDPLIALLDSTTINGELVLEDNGEFVYTPAPDFNGVDTFTYQATDGPSLSDRTVVTLRVLPQNDSPVAADDTYATAEDIALIRGFGEGVLANDSDVDLDSLSVVVVVEPANGVLELDASDGSFVYTPNLNFNGEDRFRYQAFDGALLSGEADVTITVDPRNDAPTATDDAYDGIEDEDLIVVASGVLDNDADVDGDVITAILVSPPGEGVVDLEADGSFVYTGRVNFSGVDSFTYQVTDGVLRSGVATVTLNIDDSNDPPEAFDDVAEVNEDSILIVPAPGVLANDSDRDLDGIVVHEPGSVSASFGVLSLAADGSYRYVPDSHYFGEDSFEYQVQDETAEAALSEMARVVITINAVNDSPEPLADAYVVDEDLLLEVDAVLGVLSNDFDREGDALVVELLTPTVRGALTLRSDGSFNYAAAPNTNGVDSFTYRVFDGVAYSSPPTAVEITVNPVNDAPVAVDDLCATREDIPLTPGDCLNLLENDSDVDLDVLTARLETDAANGTVMVLPSGLFRYTPDFGFNGLDSFEYVISDGLLDSAPATVSINVGVENDAPVARDDVYSAIEDTPLVVATPGVLDNDEDSDIPGAVAGVDILAQLNVSPAHGRLDLFADGGFVYTPDADYNGPDAFSYYVFDGIEFSASATVELTVDQRNDQPTAADDAYSVAEDETLDLTGDPAVGVLATDGDIDLADPDVPGDLDDIDELVAELVTPPAHAEVFVLNADGTFRYRAEDDYFGPDSFVYQAVDPDGSESGGAVVNITVTPENDAPVGLADAYVVDEDTSLIVDPAGVLINDTDVDGDDLSAELDAGPPAEDGLVLLAGDGSFVFTPSADFNGLTSFTYRVSDGRSLSTPVTVEIDVQVINDAPVALDDEYLTLEDEVLVVDAPGLLLNDVDIDADLLEAFIGLNGLHGVAFVGTDGSLRYVPDADFNGEDLITYFASDGVLESLETTVIITVEAVNDAPVGVDDGPYVLDEDGVFVATLVDGVLSNDTDVDEDSLEALLVASPSFAETFTLNGDGSFEYVPVENYDGPDSFTYRASDGRRNSSLVTVSLVVEPVNDAPVAAADAYAADEDTTLIVSVDAGLLANDVDIDEPSDLVDDPMTVEVRRTPTNGDLVMNPDGSFAYTPDPDFRAVDSFTYQAFDGFLRSAYTTVTITVDDFNDAPVVVDDAYGVVEDTPLVVAAPGVLGNDTDVEGDAMTARLEVAPTHAASFTLSPDGSFAYTPEADYVGVDGFEYEVVDAREAVSARAFVTLTVGAENDAPVGTLDVYEVDEDDILVVVAPGVLDNDSDVDEDPLSTIPGTPPASGSLVLASDGSFTYAPSADFNGFDSFSYQAFDGVSLSDPTTVEVTVTAVNDVAVPIDDTYVTIEDGVLAVDALSGVLANDLDVEGDVELVAELVDDAPNGLVTLAGDGSFTYTPNLDFVGLDTFTYKINDDGLESVTASVDITVTGDSDPPIVADDSFDMDEDDVLIVSSVSGVLANDLEPDGEPMDAVLVATTTSGVLDLNDNGSFTYTPGLNFNGVDTFTYQATDGVLSSVEATATITVAPVNDAPTATDDTYAVTEEIELSVSRFAGVLINDVDIEGDDMTAALVTDVEHGTLALAANGSFTYTSDVDFSGIDTFTYRADDDLASGGEAVVTITVGDGNDAPVAVDDVYVVDEDTPLDRPILGGVLANDIDADGDSLTVELDVDASAGILVLEPDGSFVYSPFADVNGADFFRYRVVDGRGGEDIGRVDITVTPVNDAPRPVDDVADDVVEDVLYVSSGSVLDNDVEVDGDTLTEAILVADALNGTLTLSIDPVDGSWDGTWTYAPNDNYYGPDSFQYRAADGVGPDSSPATVTITVSPVNDAPTGVANIYFTPEDTPLSVGAPGVLADDTDVDGDSITAAVEDLPGNGSVIVNSDGSFDYTPDADFSGPDVFTYTANDGALSSTPISVTVNVGAEDDAPLPADDAYVVTEDTVLSVDVFAGMLANDFDLDGDPLTVVGIDALPALGDLVWADDGSFTYTPDTDEDGDRDGATVDDVFTYRVSDGAIEVAAQVEITILPVNDAPRGLGEAFVTDEDAPFVAGIDDSVLDNDVDVEGDAFTAVLILEPSNGSLVLNADGSFTYTPDLNYHGPDSFRYAPQDADRGATQTVEITVEPVNDAPEPTADVFAVDEDTLLVGDVATNDSDVDSDVDGDVLVFTLVDDVDNGVLTLGSDGVFTYTPAADWFSAPAPDTFTYDVSDGRIIVGPTTVEISVTPQPDVPRGATDSYGTSEDIPLVVDAAAGVLDNDVEVDGAVPFEGEAMTAELVAGPSPSQGDVVLAADGSFTFTPAADFNSTVSAVTFTYRPVDDDGPGADVVVDITVDAVNDAPVALDDGYAPTEDEPFTIGAPGVLVNDTDVEGDGLAAALVSDVSSGTLALAADGSFTYTPTADFTGVDSFTYRVSDSDPGSVATVTLSVGAVNDKPTCVADGPFDVTEDVPLDTDIADSVVANDDDIDGDALGAVLATVLEGAPEVAHGTLTLRADGTFLYAPDLHYVGADSFAYRPTDGTDSGDSFCVVTLDVLPVNDAPVTADDGYGVDEDVVLTVDAGSGVLVNDLDVELDSLTAVLVSDVSSGSLALAADGSFVYTPAADFAGVDSFTYRATDSEPGSVATVTLSVGAVNDKPTCVADGPFDVTEDAPLDTDIADSVLANDDDIDGDVLGAVLATVLEGAPEVAHGTLALRADGTFVYVPDLNYVGADSFAYRPTDGTDSGDSFCVVTLDVLPVNDAPVAADDGYGVDEDVVLTVDAGSGVLANDDDVDSGVLTATVVAAPDPAEGVLALALDGSFTFTPAAEFSGTVVFRYSVSDSLLAAEADVTITIAPVNDPPVGTDDAYSTDLEAGLVVDALSGVLANDTDVELDGLSVVLPAVDLPDNGSLTLFADGSFVYQPDAGFIGGDSFQYTVTDGTTPVGPVTVTLTVEDPALPPTAVDDAYVTSGNVTLVQPAFFGVLANDLTTESDAFTLTPIVAGATALGGTVDLAADGGFTYVPPVGEGGVVDSFDYTITDDDGPDVGTVSITLGTVVWFVDNASSPGGDGREGTPFDTLAAAETASLADEIIFVHVGDGTNTGMTSGITLKSGQHLIGEGVELVVDSVVLSSAGQNPVISNSGGIIVEVPSSVSGDIEVAGLTLSDGTSGVDVGVGLAAGDRITIRDVFIIETDSGVVSGSGVLDIDDSNIWAGGGVILNEVLSVPDTDTGSTDTDCSGAVDASDDQFVEIVNNLETNISVGSMTVSVDAAVRHDFAEGTTLAAGDSIVLVSGDPSACVAPAGVTYVQSDTPLAIDAGGDSVTLQTETGQVLSSLSFGAGSGIKESLVRSPDLTGSELVGHSSVGIGPMSPGQQSDGSDFVAPSYGMLYGILTSSPTVEISNLFVIDADTAGAAISESPAVSILGSNFAGCVVGLEMSHSTAVSPSVSVQGSTFIGAADTLGDMTSGIVLTGHPSGGVFQFVGNTFASFSESGVDHSGDGHQASPSVYTLMLNSFREFQGVGVNIQGAGVGMNSEYVLDRILVESQSSVPGAMLGTGVVLTTGGDDDMELTIVGASFNSLDSMMRVAAAGGARLTMLVKDNEIGVAAPLAGARAIEINADESSIVDAHFDTNFITPVSGDIGISSAGGAAVGLSMVDNEASQYVFENSGAIMTLEGDDPSLELNMGALGNSSPGGPPVVVSVGAPVTAVPLGSVPEPSDD
jgi:VCBS repeat-containing protein